MTENVPGFCPNDTEVVLKAGNCKKAIRAESVSMISGQYVVAAHPHAAASWRGRALCPAAERKHRCTF